MLVASQICEQFRSKLDMMPTVIQLGKTVVRPGLGKSVVIRMKTRPNQCALTKVKCQEEPDLLLVAQEGLDPGQHNLHQWKHRLPGLHQVVIIIVGVRLTPMVQAQGRRRLLGEVTVADQNLQSGDGDGVVKRCLNHLFPIYCLH